MTRMKRTPRRPARVRAGFTLMEVLLVLAILVILGTLAVTNFSRVFAGAKIKAARSQLNQFKTPLNIYQMDTGAYPDNNQGLEALRVLPPDLANAGNWNGPYLSTDIPLDPWENPYGYERIDQNSYRVYSAGPDGQLGSDDDIVEVSGG